MLHEWTWFLGWLHDIGQPMKGGGSPHKPSPCLLSAVFVVCSSLFRDGALDTSSFNVSMSAGGVEILRSHIVEISWVRLSFHIFEADFLVLWLCEPCSLLLSHFPWAFSIGIVCGCVVWGWTPQSVVVLCILTELRISVLLSGCCWKRLLLWGAVTAAPVWGVIAVLDSNVSQKQLIFPSFCFPFFECGHLLVFTQRKVF